MEEKKNSQLAAEQQQKEHEETRRALMELEAVRKAAEDEQKRLQAELQVLQAANTGLGQQLADKAGSFEELNGAYQELQEQYEALLLTIPEAAELEPPASPLPLPENVSLPPSDR